MSYSLPTNQRIKLTLTAVDTAQLPSPTKNETFQSSNVAIATVNAQGKVTPVASGDVIITCKADSKGVIGLTADFAITVVSSNPTALLVAAVVV
jgi:uncharacterized protein YjdB